jgi:hypothetical protein
MSTFIWAFRCRHEGFRVLNFTGLGLSGPSVQRSSRRKVSCLWISRCLFSLYARNCTGPLVEYEMDPCFIAKIHFDDAEASIRPRIHSTFHLRLRFLDVRVLSDGLLCSMSAYVHDTALFVFLYSWEEPRPGRLIGLGQP